MLLRRDRGNTVRRQPNIPPKPILTRGSILSDGVVGQPIVLRRGASKKPLRIAAVPRAKRGSLT
jgi:hypothetical protein